jgi:hypothetical protein
MLQNPLAYVIEGMVPIRDHDFPLTDLKIKNSEAMVSLLRGVATKSDMDILITMSNITEVLWEMGFGSEYQNVCLDGRTAILSIVQRATEHGRFTPTGPEITKLNTLMELHDAQMDVITVKDMETAIARVKARIRHADATKLPPIPDNLL